MRALPIRMANIIPEKIFMEYGRDGFSYIMFPKLIKLKTIPAKIERIIMEER